MHEAVSWRDSIFIPLYNAGFKEISMGTAKAIIARIPILRSIYRATFNIHARRRFKSMSPKDVFTAIHERDSWSGEGSVSGTGSTLDQTAKVAQSLPTLLKEFTVQSVLDIPCGDFHWMKDVDLSGITYTGADIVDDLVREQTERYACDNVSFRNLDLIKDDLPQVDMVLCRDCLVHFSLADATAALRNICRSQSKYLLTTTFTERKDNSDIVTGQWHTLNLQLAPFRLPAPVHLLDEACTEGSGSYADKALGLWLIADIEKSLSAG
jgi:hypothetical protein